MYNSTEAYRKEYAVEVNNKEGFDRQIDVYSDLKEAETYVRNHTYSSDTDLETEDECYNIMCINYDENENEISTESVY